MKQYELMPRDGHKSFYGKAVVTINDNGDETLYSYNTPIITRTAAGALVRLWDGWTATTGRHIAAFCGMNKKAFMAIECTSPAARDCGGRWLTNAESYNAMISRRFAG